LVNLHDQVLFEMLLLLNVALQHLLFKLDSVQFNHKVGVLLGLLLDLVLVPVLLLDGIDLQSSDVSLLVSEVLVELIDLLQVLLLARLGVGGIGHHVILVQMHEASFVVLVVPCLDNFVYVLSELQYDFILLIGFDLLKLLLALELLDLGPMLG